MPVNTYTRLAAVFFKDKIAEQKWTNQQKQLLLTSQVLKVIKNIKVLANGNNKEAEKLIAYYQSNKDRMDYQACMQMGCGIIGSGAIESAHRTVIQKRMNCLAKGGVKKEHKICSTLEY